MIMAWWPEGGRVGRFGPCRDCGVATTAALGLLPACQRAFSDGVAVAKLRVPPG